MDLDLSRGALGERMGVNPWTVLNWERNKTQPGAKHLGRITRFLGYFPLTAGVGDLPAQVLETRQRLGLTQAGLAARIGVEECAVRNWERARQRPRCLRLAALLDCMQRANGLNTPVPGPDGGVAPP